MKRSVRLALLCGLLYLSLLLVACSKRVALFAPATTLPSGVHVRVHDAYVDGERVYVKMWLLNTTQSPLHIDRDEMALRLPDGQVLARSVGVTSRHNVYSVPPGESHDVFVDFRASDDLVHVTQATIILGGVSFGADPTPRVAGEVELSTVRAPSGESPPAAAAPATASFPATAAGFAFGSSPEEAQQVCEAAEHEWSGSEEDGRCSGVGANVDLRAEVSLTFANKALTGLLLSIAVDPDSSVWLKQFRSLEQTIQSKYGDPYTRQIEQPRECKDAVEKCFQEGKASRVTLWRWGTSYVKLRLGRVENDAALPLLSVEYFTPPKGAQSPARKAPRPAQDAF